MPKPYQYGQSPNPKDWHEAAQAIKSLSQKKKVPTVYSFEDLDKLFKEKK
jgi:hypothetical protein